MDILSNTNSSKIKQNDKQRDRLMFFNQIQSINNNNIDKFNLLSQNKNENVKNNIR